MIPVLIAIAIVFVVGAFVGFCVADYIASREKLELQKKLWDIEDAEAEREKALSA